MSPVVGGAVPGAAGRAGSSEPVRDVETARRDVAVDGRRLAVFESGAGEPCLLLHGYPQSHHTWDRVVPHLAASHRVVAVDWLGWGDSERSLEAAPEYDQEVSRLSRLIDALDLPHVNLFAHDYGGFLALGFAARRPERVARLAILNSRAHATFPAAWYLRFAALSLLARTPLLGAAFHRLPLHALHARSLRRYVANGSFTRDELERDLRFLRQREGRRWLGWFYRHYRVALRPELAAACARIAAPAAVVWGDRDPYCPFAIAADLAERLPRARLVRIAGADHYVPQQRPDEVASALLALLREPAAQTLDAASSSPASATPAVTACHR